MAKFREIPVVISVFRKVDNRVQFSEITDEEVKFEWNSDDNTDYWDEHALVPEVSVVNIEDISIVHPSASDKFTNGTLCGKDVLFAVPYEKIVEILL